VLVCDKKIVLEEVGGEGIQLYYSIAKEWWEIVLEVVSPLQSRKRRHLSPTSPDSNSVT